MSNIQESYVNAAKRGNQSSPSTLQPGKVVSADKDEFKVKKYEIKEDDEEPDNEVDVPDNYKKDPDYLPESEEDDSEEGSEEEEEAEEGSDEEGSDEEEEGSEEEEVEEEDKAEEDYKNDPDYVPDEEESESGDEEEDDYNYVPGYMAPVEYYVPPHEPEYGIEKVFGCDGCDYEWKDGWKEGWKAAMKFIEEQANQNRKAPEAPTCDNCGIACKTKKCGGSCNGSVMYCNEKCQFIHWKKTHKFACIKK